MIRFLIVLMYLGVGCAYQATYEDVTLHQVLTGDVTVAAVGHLLAWWAPTVRAAWSVLGWAVVVFLVVFALLVAVVVLTDRAGPLLRRWRREHAAVRAARLLRRAGGSDV